MQTFSTLRVAIHGTFDVANYGDLLFPHLLRHGLHPVPHEVLAFSPRGGAVGWVDTIEALPQSRAAGAGAALHVVGGGNIIHVADSPLAEYHGIEDAYAGLWIGAARLAALDGAKLAWNAPGLPRALDDTPRHRTALAGCDLLTVRDAASAAFLHGAAATVVPDTALDIARMWPAATLDNATTAAFGRHGLARPARWLVVHLNDRYLGGDAEWQAARILELARATHAAPVLIALGPCQGDDTLARAVAVHLPAGTLVLDRPLGLREIAGLIAHADGYAGSSLHGLITALSYGRPALAVASAAMIKFAGFLEHVAMPERLATGWQAAVDQAPRLLAPLGAPSIAAIARAQDRIAAHWHRLRQLIASPLDLQAQAGRTVLALPEPVLQAAPPPRAAALPEPSPPDPAPAGTCCICGGAGFRAADVDPDRIGFGAACIGCGASARHRALRKVAQALRGPHWSKGTCLRFARDRIFDVAWFAAMADSPAADALYDAIVVVDALEAAPDHRSALQFWLSRLRPGGVMLLAMRNVPGRATTLDWGFPRGDRAGEWRMFGADIAALLPGILPQAAIAEIQAADPVTTAPAIAFVIAHAAADLHCLRDSPLALRLLRPQPEAMA